MSGAIRAGSAMARTSANGAPAASVDALDNIDLDMFGEGDDDLFDGIADELGLDQMGDIANNMDTTANNNEESAAEAPKEEKTAPTPAPAPAVEEPQRRRKTKRKPKSPVLLDEEEDANEAQLKKKRRTTKSGKKKNSKKDKEKDREEVKTEPLKPKSKLKGLGLPTQLQRHASSSSGPSTPSAGVVAAAGQFGRRLNRGLPLSRANSDRMKTKKNAPLKLPGTAAIDATTTSVGSNEKTKLKKVASSASTSSSAPEPSAPKRPPPFAPPIPQSTFCGIKPSNTLFYPFMPALPPEPSIKNRKQYPHLDRLNSAFQAFINNAPNAAKGGNGGAPVPDTESIHRLMQDTLRDLNPGAQNNATTPQDDKKSAISNAVGSLRQTVSTMDRQKVATDLFAACALLKRQYDFLQQNLSNMERWCKDNFSEADYAATYGPLEAQKKEKDSAGDCILSKFKSPLIRVKVRCSTFKEPKLSGPLYALLPPSVIPTAASSENNKEKKTTKKRKSASSDASLVAATSSVIAVAEKEVVIKTYPELRPVKRRQLIAEHVAHTAKELEAACISRTASFCQAIDRRHTELKKMVEEDEVLVIHTAAMWQYIIKAGYFSDFTEETLNDTLRSVWAPEVKHEVRRDVPFVDNSLLTRMRNDDSQGSSRQSVFHGLQSLLVDASSELEGDDESDDGDNSLLHDNFDEPLRPLDPTLPPGSTIADLSGLTVDERAHMHLRRAGMLENQTLPGTIQAVNGRASNSSRGRKDGLGDGAADGPGADGGTLEDLIGRMSAHLLELNKVNNARASFLESAARTHLSASGNGKLKANREAALISKCQQLLKKSKDSKVKSAKPNAAAKDEYALPW